MPHATWTADGPVYEPWHTPILIADYIGRCIRACVYEHAYVQSPVIYGTAVLQDVTELRYQTPSHPLTSRTYPGNLECRRTAATLYLPVLCPLQRFPLNGDAGTKRLSDIVDKDRHDNKA